MRDMVGAVQRFFRPGQHLFHESDPPKSLFVVKKGTVAVRKRKAGGFVEIARLYANEVVGEISFFDRLPRSAAAVALTEVEALEIPFEALDKILSQVPDYLKTIIVSLSDRLRKADDMIRRLQKDVVNEDADGHVKDDEPDAASVLAASADIDLKHGGSISGADTQIEAGDSTSDDEEKSS